MSISNFKADNSWEGFIRSSKYLEKMLDFVDITANICPKKENVFRFFNCDICKVKCIILGMDPYPSMYMKNGENVPEATGRAFEVASVEKWTDKYKQASLAKIFKTLWYLKYDEILSINDIRKKISNKDFRYINIHDWFDAMENEGVLFLNATLTTKSYASDAHKNEWKGFMDELIRYIVNLNKSIKWLIWGNNALERVNGIVPEKNIIYTCHPASRVNNTFVKDCCFKQVDDIKWV